MTFREYIEALYSTGLFGKNKAKIGATLFDKAGSSRSVSEEAVKTWMRGSRNCNIGMYFPNGIKEETKFIAHFKSVTKVPGSWKKIQDAFRQMKQDEYFCIDLETEDPDVFFWSLLNQFQRIFRLPESERDGREQGVSVTTAPQEEREPTTPATATRQELSLEQIRTVFLDAFHQYRAEQNPVVPATAIPQEESPEQIRREFLEATHRHGIMDIINRDPPILNRNDLKFLTAFVKETEEMLNKGATPPNIRSFIMTLEYRAMDLGGKLKFRFGSTNETASINMLGDKIRLWDQVKYKVRAKRLGIPELTPELIENAADPLHLYRLLLEDWGSFRDQMNLWFEHISSDQDKT